ncbi:MAG: hypothetical protein WED04_03240 [Promethearchaeati archaeon SRVP18_Atabeyarchaeia-1]
MDNVRERNMEIKLRDMLGTGTLRDRETALFVLKEISQIPETCPVEIDFASIDFASRSFLHELLIGLKCRRNVSFQNLNNEVKNMMNVSLRKPNVAPSSPTKITVIG